MQNLKHAVRRLLRGRGLTFTAVTTLALCIGANLTIFAVVDSIVFRQLPFHDPDRLITVFNSYPAVGVDRTEVSIADYYAYRDHISAFSSVAIVTSETAIVDQSGSAIRVNRDIVSSEFFDTLGIPLLMGRSFSDEEMTPASTNVAVLTHGYWENEFDADKDVLGSTFEVNGTPTTVVGVLPESFRYLSSNARFYTPAASSPPQRLPGRRHGDNAFEMVARLAPGATPASVELQLDTLNVSQLKGHPYEDKLRDSGVRAHVVSLHGDHVRSVKPMLLFLQGGVLFLLLIGGVNLVNLLLIRASGRAKDLAIRQALGASSKHIIGEVALETLLLSLLGGVFGLAAGAGGTRLLTVLGVDQLPMGAHIAFDGRVAAVALLGAIILGIVMSLPIAWFNLRIRLASTLQSEARGGTTSHAAQRMRHAFIVAQIGIAFTLITSAGLFAFSLKKVLDTPPGFESQGVLSGRIVMPLQRYPNGVDRLGFVERLLESSRSLPGVKAVAINTQTPFTQNDGNGIVTVEGFTGELPFSHYRQSVVGEYWKALNIPLVEGRFIEDADNHRDQRVCVIDEEIARRYWPDESPLGRRLCEDGVFNEEQSFTIVGVVAAIRQNELTDREPRGTAYFPYGQRPFQGTFHLVVQSGAATAFLVPPLRGAVHQLDPELPFDDVKTMQVRIDDSLSTRRAPALVMGIVSSIALLLAAIGTYGVLAYAVGQRRREIGVCMALGATPERICHQFLCIGLRLLSLGMLVGVVGAWFTGRAIQTVLFEVSAIHFPTLAGTVAALGVVTLFACLLPSLRAARVNPVDALRSD